MIRFLKAQASSFLATFFDFSTTFVLVGVFSWNPVAATIVGTVMGGITNFTVNRYWVFEANSKPANTQIMKYLLVWTGSMLLNAGGMHLLTALLELDYRLSKIVVSLLVGFGYNFLMQKKFVFK
jgi:putative flippase GtrA